MGRNFVRGRLLPVIDGFQGRDQRDVIADYGCGTARSLTILCKARPATPKARIDGFIADARVCTDATARVFDIGTVALGRIYNIVDEGNLGSEHGGTVSEFGGSHIRINRAIVIAIERLIELLHNISGGFGLGVDDDAVELTEITGGCAFL
jgi:hypothetical protein